MSLEENYLTISQAAEYCGVDRGTIKRWISQRQLSRYSVGREALIPKAELDVVKEIRTLDDVIKEAARGAGIPVTSDLQIRMNTTLMTNAGRDVLELYYPGSTQALAVRVKLEKV